MRQDETEQRLAKVSALMELFERNCVAMDQRLQSLAEGLQGAASQLPAVVGQAADRSLQILPGQVIDRVKDGLQQPVQNYQQRLDSAGGKISEGAQALARQLQRMEQLHRLLVWKVATITAGCLVLMIAGGLWLSTHYAGVIRENQLTADLLRAYNAADVSICDGRLCANVDPTAKRHGSKSEYLLVRPP